MENANDRNSAGPPCYRAVEFVGGPMDGLRLVEGIERFGEAEPVDGRVCFSVGDSGAKYARRDRVEDGVLYLDVMEPR